MSVSLTVLGCSGSYARPDDACSGYLVRSDGAEPALLWVDAGPGTLANLQRHTTLADLDAIVVTHAHPDHFSDLCGATVAARWYLGLGPIRVITTGEVQAAVRNLVEECDEVLDWEIVGDGDVTEVAAATITFSRTDHPPETLAVRIDVAGRSIGYSSDTGPGWSPAALGPGVDLLVCEGTGVGGAHVGPHLTARQAAEGARSAGVGRLVVTHVPPTSDPDLHLAEAAEVFPGAELAVCGRRFDL